MSKESLKVGSYLKLLIGAGGIYGAFLYHGTLQEGVFNFKDGKGTNFTQVWFLTTLGIISSSTSRLSSLSPAIILIII